MDFSAKVDSQIVRESIASKAGSGQKDINVPKKHDQRVIYETDAESENDGFYEATSHFSDQQESVQKDVQDCLHDKIQRDHAVDDIPRAGRNSRSNLGTYDDAWPNTSGSEPSILCCRNFMSIPLDPITSDVEIPPERLAELFPPPSILENDATDLPLPDLPRSDVVCRTQISQQDPADISTEFVPESSQIQKQYTALRNDVHPPSPPCVILVESSQPADHHPSAHAGHEEPRCILTASQLLTDSLMESVPGPPAWMSSQEILRDEHGIAGQ
jgi:hypothetical protein